MSRWRMSVKCADCPFAKTGPGLHLRKTLALGRWAEILESLRNNQHFLCHKTTDETGDGSKLVCAGSIEWQNKHGYSANLVRIMERLDYFAEKRKSERVTP